MTKNLIEVKNTFVNIKTLLFMSVVFLTPQINPAQNHNSLNSMSVKTVVDSLSNQLIKYYVSKESAFKMSAYLKKRYDEGIYNRVEDPYELAGILTTDVNSIQKDEHLHVEYNPGLADEVLGNIEDVPKMINQKLELEKSKNYGFKKAEILFGNIGYLEISGFSRLNQYSKAAADAAFKMLAGTRAIIIDLRYGKGGSPDMVNYIAARFFKTKTHIADIYIRSENSTIPYRTVSDSSSNLFYKTPLFILTSYRTFSAAEGLAYSLQNLKRALIVGETTRGGAHTVTYKPLSNGFVCDIPFGNVIDPITKRNWEGKGVVPDIKADAENALEVAEFKIFGAAMAATKDSVTLNQLMWQLKFLKANNHPFSADTSLQKVFAGVYGCNTVSFENGKFYFQKTGMARYLLQAISNTEYIPQGNDNFRIYFEGDTPHNMNLLIYNDDGRLEKAPKSKR